MFSKLASLGLALLPAITPEKGVIGLKRKFILTVLVAFIMLITLFTALPCGMLAVNADEYSKCVVTVTREFLPLAGSDFKDE